MPRDTAGNYNLPAGNPVASGEIISASWANSTMGDLGQTLSASLDRYGRGGMLAPFQFTDGTEAAPGATWANEPTTGFYRAAYGDLRLTLTNADVQRWTNGNSYLWRNNQWEEILTSSGGSGGTTINNLVVTGSFTSPGIEDTATSIKLTINDTNVELDSDVNVTGALTVSSLVYPVADGTDGQAILTDGNGTLAFGDVVGGIDYTTETSNYTLEANQGVIADTTGGTFVVTLPLSPAEGDQVVVADGGDWSTTNLTVGRNGQTIEGVASDLIMDVGGISVTMVFDGTTWQLYPATGTSAGTTYTLDQTTTAGNITTNDITVGNLTSTGIDDNATSTAITIDANENVGVGTSTPDISGVGASGTALTVSASGSNANGILELKGTRSVGSVVSYVRSFNNAGTTPITDILSYSGPTSADTTGELAFHTSNAEAMRIDSSGNLFVGKNSLSYGVDGFIAGHDGLAGGSRTDGPPVVWNRNGSNGDLVLYRRNNNTVGSVYCTTTATTYGTSSDVRLKRNIVDAPAGNIDDIKIRSFAWKIDGSQQKYGVVAQELFEVAPEAVTKGETEEDTWGVDYSKLVPMMIKEIQDLKAEVAALKGVN